MRPIPGRHGGCAGPSLVLFAVDVYVFQLDTTFQEPNWEFVLFVLVAAVMVPIQSGYAEAFFRGYILQGLIQLSRNRVVLGVATGIIFALPHLANPEPGEFGIVPYLSSIVASGSADAADTPLS